MCVDMLPRLSSPNMKPHPLDAKRNLTNHHINHPRRDQNIKNPSYVYQYEDHHVNTLHLTMTKVNMRKANSGIFITKLPHVKPLIVE